jgi:hypothetical protein
MKINFLSIYLFIENLEAIAIVSGFVKTYPQKFRII